MFFWWIILRLLSLPEVSIQGKRPSVCDTTMKERESEDFSPCIKFNWELKECSELKIERGYVSRSKMGLNVCQAKDGGWLECTCEKHSLCIAPALKKLQVLSNVFGDTCEPEIRNELDQKKKEWSDDNGDENANDSAPESADKEETNPENYVSAAKVTTTTTKTTSSITKSAATKIHNHHGATTTASKPTPTEKIATTILQDTSSVDDSPPNGPEGNVAEPPSPITKPPNSSTSGKIDIVFYSMLGSMFHATLL